MKLIFEDKLTEDYLDQIDDDRLREIRSKLCQLWKDFYAIESLGSQAFARKLRKADEIVANIKYDIDRKLDLKWDDWE